MTVRRLLDVIADILILLALAVAGVGHFLPWFEMGDETVQASAPADDPAADAGDDADKEDLGGGPTAIDFQIWYATRSGAALAVAALLVGVSLAMNLWVGARKILVLLMFASVLAALAFQGMIWSPFPISEIHRQFVDSNWHLNDKAYLVAIVSTAVAAALCLVRMAWTMTAVPERR